MCGRTAGPFAHSRLATAIRSGGSLISGDHLDTLTFFGTVSEGIGRFSTTLRIPGRAELPNAPCDWPEQLYPGSLNVCIREGGHPPELHNRGLQLSVESLDSGRFAPEFEIPWTLIGNNTLRPVPGKPRRGDAQVWRTEIRVIGTPDPAITCWALRRFGSQVGEQLEFVSGGRLRSRGLGYNPSVIVDLVGRWTTPSTFADSG